MDDEKIKEKELTMESEEVHKDKKDLKKVKTIHAKDFEDLKRIGRS